MRTGGGKSPYKSSREVIDPPGGKLPSWGPFVKRRLSVTVPAPGKEKIQPDESSPILKMSKLTQIVANSLTKFAISSILKGLLSHGF
jgi:hypothetical protein